MKKWEKEIAQKQIKDESKILSRLKKIYGQALEEVNEKIKVLQSKEQTQSVIYQLKYQKALEKELSSVYDKMKYNYYSSVEQYLQDCYDDSFYSTMYGLHQEGIPIVMPINQKAAVQMISLASDGIKLSDKIYYDVDELSTTVRREITRGIATNSSYADITRNVAKKSEASLNQAYRIVRTEGHRVQEEVKFKTINQAQDAGADVVKQWDAAIDRRTRRSHAALDGQLREIDQPFKSPISGKTAMYPGGFGVAAEDIHCRCTALMRARWALDKSELDKYIGDLDGMTDSQLNDLAKKLGVSKTDLIKGSNGIIESDGSINHTIKAQNYNQFKKKYQTKAKTEAAKASAQAAVKATIAATPAKQGIATFEDAKKKAKKFSSDREALEYHRNHNFHQDFWDNDLSANERQAVVNYTGSDYREMNSVLRKGEYDSLHKISRTRKNIDGTTSALEKSTIADDVTLWRGMGSKNTLARSLNVSRSDLSQMVSDGSIVGRRFTEKGFSSTGVIESSGWDKEVFLEIYAPAGTKGMYVAPISNFKRENELLLQRNTTYEILKAERVGDKYKLYVLVVDQTL